MQGATRRRLAPALAGLVFFAIMASLYLSHSLGVYYWIIRFWGVRPFPTPFDDTDTVMSALRCLRQGVDVLVTNPCDPERRLFDYSPLWLSLAVLPVTLAWLNWAGLLVDFSFFAALLMLPAGRDRTASWMIAAGVISSATLFAVERGNNDLVLFTLAALAAALLLRLSWARYAGYALLLLAGLLKYYPMAAMGVALTERLPRFLAVAAISILFTAIFIVGSWHDLSRALVIIPIFSPFSDSFGSIDVGLWVTEVLHVSRRWAAVARWPMTGVSLWFAVRLANRRDTHAALAWLSPGERSFLIVGSLYIIGCFFTAQNIGYRAVHLLLVLPSLTALRRGEASPRLHRAAVVALVLLWEIFWRSQVGSIGRLAAGDLGQTICLIVSLLVREWLWWWLVTQLLAIVIAFALRSPAFMDLRHMLAGGPFWSGAPARSGPGGVDAVEPRNLR